MSVKVKTHLDHMTVEDLKQTTNDGVDHAENASNAPKSIENATDG